MPRMIVTKLLILLIQKKDPNPAKALLHSNIYKQIQLT